MIYLAKRNWGTGLGWVDSIQNMCSNHVAVRGLMLLKSLPNGLTAFFVMTCWLMYYFKCFLSISMRLVLIQYFVLLTYCYSFFGSTAADCLIAPIFCHNQGRFQKQVLLEAATEPAFTGKTTNGYVTRRRFSDKSSTLFWAEALCRSWGMGQQRGRCLCVAHQRCLWRSPKENAEAFCGSQKYGCSGIATVESSMKLYQPSLFWDVFFAFLGWNCLKASLLLDVFSKVSRCSLQRPSTTAPGFRFQMLFWHVLAVSTSFNMFKHSN